MSNLIRSFGLTLAAAALFAAAPQDDPAAYRLRVSVTPGGGSGAQRVSLPAVALGASLTADQSDLRVFDARGRAMPIARAPATGPAARRDVLKAMPILGAADALNVKTVSLRLDDHGRARVAEVDGTIADGAGQSIVLGSLFDARSTAGAARALALDADVPVGQPVTFRIEASPDLAIWRTLGEKVVYRDAGSAVDTNIPLGLAALDRDYLKVTWRLASRALSPVTVRQATLLTRPNGPAADTRIDADAPPLGNAHALEFTLPFRTPIATIRITTAGDDVVVPVRILGRDNAEQPWMPIGGGIAARPSDSPTDITLGGTFRTMRIEADTRTPGFTAAPRIAFGFAPRDLLFLAAGQAPYTLAVGQSGATDTYLPAATLTAQAGGDTAVATVSAPPARITLPAIDDAGSQRRRLALWAVLLLGTALLAGLAWLLWRRNAADARSGTQPS